MSGGYLHICSHSLQTILCSTLHSRALGSAFQENYLEGAPHAHSSKMAPPAGCSG